MAAKKKPVWSLEKIRLGVQIPLDDSIRIARLFGVQGSFASTSHILSALELACEGEELAPDDLAEIETMRSAAVAARTAAAKLWKDKHS